MAAACWVVTSDLANDVSMLARKTSSISGRFDNCFERISGLIWMLQLLPLAWLQIKTEIIWVKGWISKTWNGYRKVLGLWFFLVLKVKHSAISTAIDILFNNLAMQWTIHLLLFVSFLKQLPLSRLLTIDNQQKMAKLYQSKLKKTKWQIPIIFHNNLVWPLFGLAYSPLNLTNLSLSSGVTLSS